MTMSSVGYAGCLSTLISTEITETDHGGLYSFTALLQLFLSPRHTSPTLMAECSIISVTYQFFLISIISGDADYEKHLNLMVSIANILPTVWKAGCSCGMLLSINPLPWGEKKRGEREQNGSKPYLHFLRGIGLFLHARHESVKEKDENNISWPVLQTVIQLSCHTSALLEIPRLFPLWLKMEECCTWRGWSYIDLVRAITFWKSNCP